MSRADVNLMERPMRQETGGIGSQGSMQVGVEIGGTFTDLVWLREDGTVVTGKVPSTPGQVEKAVLACLDNCHQCASDALGRGHGPADDRRLSRHRRDRHPRQDRQYLYGLLREAAAAARAQAYP